MKILFICTSLEPGRDGVGDYTRRLAHELARQGHSCFLVALKDRFVSSAMETAESTCGVSKEEETGVLTILRLPEKDPTQSTWEKAREFCEKIKPDWISLQLVLYGFDPRGVCFKLGRQLQKLCRGIPLQIMFHELWIGEAEQSSLKQKFLGRLQRGIVADLLRRLRPVVVHTHTPLYVHHLAKLNCLAIRLPLFGNIPVATDASPDWLARQWSKANVVFDAADRDRWSIFVIFGSIHPEWDGEYFMEQALVSIRAAGKHMALMAIGRLAESGEKKWRQLADRYAASCQFFSFGEQPVEIISQCLRAADFGISAVPPEYLFKSGTAVAMLEHGLPVIITRLVGNYRNCPEEVLRERLPNSFTHFHFEKMSRRKPLNFLPEVAAQFIQDLGRTSALQGNPA